MKVNWPLTMRAAAIFAVLTMTCCAPLHAQEFPVEVEHRFGTARIAEAPQRVVSIGFIEHDFLLSLGVVPVGLRRWYGDHPYGVWPWAQEALGDVEPYVMQGEIDVERIAFLEPDLIVGQWSGMTARQYALLSQIAPTLAPQAGAGDYGMPWPSMLRQAALATGRNAQAEAIIARLEARFAGLRAAHPDWQDKSAVMVWAGQTGAYTREDVRGRFLEDLGFTVPDAVNELGTERNFYVLIPAEDPSPIDTDVLIWIDAIGSVAGLERMPLRPMMRAYHEGREVYSDPLLSAALSHSSPLSLDYALDRLVPLIEQAADGDPATVVRSSEQMNMLRSHAVSR